MSWMRDDAILRELWKQEADGCGERSPPNGGFGAAQLRRGATRIAWMMPGSRNGGDGCPGSRRR